MRIAKITSKKLFEEEVVQVRRLLELADWNKEQINGQLEGIKKFLSDKNCIVLFAVEDDEIIGYITAQFYAWNRLGQIHGLVIHPDWRRKGSASHLVKEVQVFMRTNQARGIYVDTPTNNTSGCIFYKNNGFRQAYIMPEYYDDGLDGVTFIKLFTKERKA